MRRLQLVAIIGFFLAVPAWAQEPAAAVAAVHDASEAASSLPKVQQRITHDQAEVMRLQREVARQESDSRRAGQRLQQQDREIAELQRELSQLRDNPAARQP